MAQTYDAPQWYGFDATGADGDEVKVTAEGFSASDAVHNALAQPGLMAPDPSATADLARETGDLSLLTVLQRAFGKRRRAVVTTDGICVYGTKLTLWRNHDDSRRVISDDNRGAAAWFLQRDGTVDGIQAVDPADPTTADGQAVILARDDTDDSSDD